MRFKKPIVKLPKDMDEECVSLCKTLNLLPGIYTRESCCGHLKEPFRIFFRCSSFTSLAVLARAIDNRYCGMSKVWSVLAETADKEPRFNFQLTSVVAYNSKEEMDKDVEMLIKNIKYWVDNYWDYFKTNGERV